MASIDFIQKRIAGKEKEINRLEKKLARIRKAEASGWEDNPYYYSEHDPLWAQRDLEAARQGLKDNLIRYWPMNRHLELVRGSSTDMQVARGILHLLNRGEIRLGLGGDVDWKIEQELDHAGVHVKYSSNGYTAYARIYKPNF